MTCWASSFALVAKLWRELRKGFLDAYRPELHYMRGPGPRWREKHAAASPHNGGTQGGARDLSKGFRIGAPGTARSHSDVDSSSGHSWRLTDEQPWRRAYVVLEPGSPIPFRTSKPQDVSP